MQQSFKHNYIMIVVVLTSNKKKTVVGTWLMEVLWGFMGFYGEVPTHSQHRWHRLQIGFGLQEVADVVSYIFLQPI